MSGPVLGIDLGTTNSVVAVADGAQSRVLYRPDGDILIPSVVSFLPEGGIVVGDEAKDRRLVDPHNTVYSVKRLIGRPYDSPEVRRAQERFACRIVERQGGGVSVDVRGELYTLTEISAFVLREVRRVAEEVLGEPCTRAVITVPANFNELQRSATKAAGKVAGLDVARIINEPTAAALAYGYQDRPERVAVYDLGGGTFDITILELEDDVFEVVATAGDTFLGGDDFDQAIADVMAKTFAEEHGVDPLTERTAWERLRAAGEWVKINLSAEQEVRVRIEELAPSPHGAPLDLDFTMTRKELETTVEPLLARSFDVTKDALEQAGMKASEVDSVILVGGSTRMPLVRRQVEAYFDQPPKTGIDPDLVVAQGAAIHGLVLGGEGAKPKKKLAPPPPPPDAIKPRAPGRQGPARPRPPTPKAKPTARRRTVEGVPPPPPTGGGVPETDVAGLPPVLGGLFGGEGESSPAEPSSAVEPESGSGLLELELDELQSIPPQEAGLEERGPAPPPSGLPPALGEPDSIVVDDGYAAEVESFAPGGLRRYRDAGAGDVDIEVDLPELPEPPTVPEAPQTGFELDLGDDWAQADSLGGPSPAAGPAASAPPRDGTTPAELPAEHRASVAIPERPAPLLMDVTPQSLGLETAGGYCQHLIERNSPIPAEQTRTFTTARDGQQAVTVRVCQGETREFAENQLLGEVELTELRQAPRGQVRIEVSFILDANGTLDVKAVDVATGREQSIRINLLGGLESSELDEMRERQQSLLEASP